MINFSLCARDVLQIKYNLNCPTRAALLVRVVARAEILARIHGPKEAETRGKDKKR